MLLNIQAGCLRFYRLPRTFTTLFTSLAGHVDLKLLACHPSRCLFSSLFCDWNFYLRILHRGRDVVAADGVDEDLSETSLCIVDRATLGIDKPPTWTSPSMSSRWLSRVRITDRMVSGQLMHSLSTTCYPHRSKTLEAGFTTLDCTIGWKVSMVFPKCKTFLQRGRPVYRGIRHDVRRTTLSNAECPFSNFVLLRLTLYVRSRLFLFPMPTLLWKESVGALQLKLAPKACSSNVLVTPTGARSQVPWFFDVWCSGIYVSASYCFRLLSASRTRPFSHTCPTLGVGRGWTSSAACLSKRVAQLVANVIELI